tara:strand:+ start:348 stop:452 length:105 start_codon:yes stop_codon:yes gene_type:complete
VIKRSIQHLLPAVSVFLDVDDLEEVLAIPRTLPH